jgi:hypothetical protein
MKALKTGKQLCIPLNPDVTAILNKYKHKLPILSTQYYKRELKKLVKLAGVDKEISWMFYNREKKDKDDKKVLLSEVFSNHCCSRSAITYFFDLGFASNQIAEMFGKSLRTMMAYYYGRSSENEIFNKTAQLNWGVK